MWCYVYVLGCRDKDGVRTYVGWTTDIEARLRRHNAGRGAKSTRGRRWVLLYGERFATRNAAMSREWRLKRARALRREVAENLFGASDEDVPSS
ncbi:GIY-YIG nuclease family protein [Varunaivibrio sulfuroxidans]|uniref:Putative endonuclease n=1 Tax=Varunaivibrio sulfuroxidans TaxID=1773489 RepID=A0A4R3JAF1_9PROT|nr:GIY-YIG nuclease family protein [Varunaivibrio sulfuroxidans]TCS61610.1 putative endonuclease [Varunaivibrio sulfuroxidans]WES29515.1 GIY-YIG nuclease family protein [Varunaivibrio sulfuroxidans]